MERGKPVGSVATGGVEAHLVSGAGGRARAAASRRAGKAR